MKKLVQRGIVVVSLVAAMGIAFGQVQGQGQGQVRRGGGFGRQMGGQRGGGELQLVMRSDVQADLKVTEDQKTKLTALRGAGRGQGGQRGQRTTGAAGATGTRGTGTGGTGTAGAQGGAQGQRGQRGQGTPMSEADRAAMVKRMEDMRAEQHKQLAAILDAGQLKRLAEIAVQLQGNRAIQNPETQRTLGLSAAQLAKLKDLNDKQQEANRAIFQKMQDQELTREEAQATFEKNTKVMNDELAKVLTGDQAAKLKAMGGAPFKADPSIQNGRGGGGL